MRSESFQRVTEIRVRTVLTHNLSQVDLSAAWTGQQRFQGSGAAGGAAQAFWRSREEVIEPKAFLEPDQNLLLR